MSYLVRPIEAPQDSVALVFADAGAGVLDAHDGFVIAAHQPDVHPAAGRREFDGVVDEISHRLNEKITVPINVQLVGRLNDQADPLIFRYRFIHVAHLTYKSRKCDLAETG